jgi:hypothetical protein
MDTSTIATTISIAPILEKTVTGSCRITIEAITAITISESNKTVEVDADRCFNPSSHK